MNREDIIRMAREAGAELAELPMGDAWLFAEDEHLERFAALVASAEREACIELVAFHGGPVDLEAAIRARGQA